MAARRPKRPKAGKKPKANAPVAVWLRYADREAAKTKAYQTALKEFDNNIKLREAAKKRATTAISARARVGR